MSNGAPLTRVCTKCHKELPLSAFYYERARSYRRRDCAQCLREAAKRDGWGIEKRRSNSIRRRDLGWSRETDARRRATPLRKLKRRAHYLVAQAIKHGDLIPRPCACGKPWELAHHEDYLKPLVVIWYCTQCHRERHASIYREYEDWRNEDALWDIRHGEILVDDAQQRRGPHRDALPRESDQ